MPKISLPINSIKVPVKVYLPNKKVPFMCVPIEKDYYGIVNRDNLQIQVGRIYFRLKVLASGFKSSGAKENYIVVEILEHYAII